jgi:hypothetical protein
MANEGRMDEDNPRKRRTTKFVRSKRILERLGEGFGCDEMAGQEKLTERRVRQIVAEALQGREALEGAVHAHMQIARLGRAAPVAGEARSRGDIRAVAPFIAPAVGAAHKPLMDMGGLIRRENRVPRGGGGVRNLDRKPLIFLDSEKEMQGNANVFSLFSTPETASKPVAARS